MMMNLENLPQGLDHTAWAEVRDYPIAGGTQV